MNMDTGALRLWAQLTTEERESGRWVKLGEGEYAEAQSIEQHERRQMLNRIFNTPSSSIAGAPGDERRGGFDALGRPRSRP